MNYNLNSAQYRQPTRKNQTLATKLTSNSLDLTSHFPFTLVNILSPHIARQQKQAFLKLKSKEVISNEMVLFINHCATIIQSRWRGYWQKKHYRAFLPVMKRFKQLLGAVVAGWKVRRIMQTGYIQKKCDKIRSISNLREIRIHKRQLVEDIGQLQKKGRWLMYVQDKKNKEQLKIVSIKDALHSHRGDQSKQTPKENSKNKKVESIKIERIEKIENIERKERNHNEEEVPIKASGFYKVADLDNNLIETGRIGKPTQQENKKKVNKKPTSKTQQPPQQKQSPKIKEKGKVEESTVNTSNLLINLPAQQFVVHEQVPLMGQTIKLDFKQPTKTPQNEEQSKPRKAERKGIKVTLSNSQKVSTYHQYQPIQLKVYHTQDMTSNPLIEMLDVYNNTYSNKKAEIILQLTEMRKKRKFLQ